MTHEGEALEEGTGQRLGAGFRCPVISGIAPGGPRRFLAALRPAASSSATLAAMAATPPSFLDAVTALMEKAYEAEPLSAGHMAWFCLLVMEDFQKRLAVLEKRTPLIAAATMRAAVAKSIKDAIAVALAGMFSVILAPSPDAKVSAVQGRQVPHPQSSLHWRWRTLTVEYVCRPCSWVC